MNAERLLELVQFLTRGESNYDLQGRLTYLRMRLDELASSPGDTSFQENTGGAVSELEQVFGQFEAQVTPAIAHQIEEVGFRHLFGPALPAGIKALLAANGVTPAAVRDRVSELEGERARALERLRELERSMPALRVGIEHLDPGEAELGFLLPRALFSNRLKQFADELSQLDKIVRLFSEAATGSAEDAELHGLSASDPLVFLGIDVVTAAAIGGAVTWVIATIKGALEIRKLRAEVRRLGLPDDIAEMMDAHNAEKLKGQIAAKAKEIVQEAPVSEPRRNELENGMNWALTQIMAKVERGMTVELRFLPPSPAQAEDRPETAAAYEQLKVVSQELEFPKLEGELITPLLGPIVDGVDPNEIGA